jgi:hypothetical protein
MRALALALTVVAACGVDEPWTAGPPPSSGAKADGACTRRAVLVEQHDVWEQIPRFQTGVGWVGTVVAFLPRDTQLFICSERDAEFGLSTKRWFQIAFREHDTWGYGWTEADDVADWEGE